MTDERQEGERLVLNISDSDLWIPIPNSVASAHICGTSWCQGAVMRATPIGKYHPYLLGNPNMELPMALPWRVGLHGGVTVQVRSFTG